MVILYGFRSKRGKAFFNASFICVRQNDFPFESDSVKKTHKSESTGDQDSSIKMSYCFIDSNSHRQHNITCNINLTLRTKT